MCQSVRIMNVEYSKAYVYLQSVKSPKTIFCVAWPYSLLLPVIILMFMCNYIKLYDTHQSHQVQEASFQETAATSFQTDSTFQRVSY